jgi:hypothetical protein
VINTDIKTTGQLLDALDRMSESQRRALLDKTRLSIGLESTADVEAHERFVQANRALLYRPKRPVPTCAVCGSEPVDSAGMPTEVASCANGIAVIMSSSPSRRHRPTHAAARPQFPRARPR